MDPTLAAAPPTWLGLTLLAGAAAALVASSLRVASLVVPRGLPRVTATATLAAAAAVLASLALGLVDLGAEPVALLAAAGLLFVAVHAAVPRPAVSARAEARAWWSGLAPTGRLAAAGVVGLFGAWAVWLGFHPYVDYDGMFQNLLRINLWAHNGAVGSREAVFAAAPVEAFPATNDVLLLWASVLAHSFATMSLVGLALLVVLGVATRALLAELAVPRGVALGAVVAVVSLPHLTAQVNSPKSDLAAVAWLACAAALAAAARRGDPRLLGVAIVAGGLSVGAKTTTAGLVVGIVVAGAWLVRDRWREALPAVAAGSVVALATGGVWYVVNLIDHGSPLWPFWSTPWGDPKAVIYERGGSTFAQDPIETLRTQLRDWAGVAAGGLLLIAAGVVAGLAARRRATVVGAVVVLGALAVWTTAPVTGLDNEPLAGGVLSSTTRYLAPVMLAGAVTLGVVARERPRWTPLVAAALGTAAAWNLAATAVYWRPIYPGVGVLAAGILVGVATGVAVDRRPSLVVPVLSVGALGAAAITFLLTASTWNERHRDQLRFGGEVIEQLLADPRFRAGNEPVAVTNIAWSDLAGERLGHPVHLLPGGIGCAELDDWHARGWVVLVPSQFFGMYDDPLARGCLADTAPTYAEETTTVYAPKAATLDG